VIERSQTAKFMMRQFVDVLMERVLVTTKMTRVAHHRHQGDEQHGAGENHFRWVAVFNLYQLIPLVTCIFLVYAHASK